MYSSALEPTADTRCDEASTSKMEVDKYTGTTSNTMDWRSAIIVACRGMARRVDL